MGLDQYIQFVFALAFVIALILLAAWAMRRAGFGGMIATPSRQRRLGVVEVLPLDAKRRLVLVRRDDQEHLLLLSAFGDAVVDGAARGGFRAAMSDATTVGAVPALGGRPSGERPSGERPSGERP